MTRPPLIQEFPLERHLVRDRHRCEQDIQRCFDSESRTFCPWYSPDKVPTLQRELDQILAVIEFLRQAKADGKSYGVDL